MGEIESTAARVQPAAPIFDQFLRFISLFFDEYHILHLSSDTNPRRAYCKNEELIGPPFHYFRQDRYFRRDKRTAKYILALDWAIVDCGPDVH